MSHSAARQELYQRRALDSVASRRVHPVCGFLDKPNWHLQSKGRLRPPVRTVLSTNSSFAAWTDVPAVGSPDRHVWGGMTDVDRPGKRQLKVQQGRSAEYDSTGIVGVV